jgi:anti-sigma28 factor (negative regulator of flagellin synthesis)
MVDILTTAAAPSRSVNNSKVELPQPAHKMQSRQQRITQLREAIETGEYHVAAADLADALLRGVRRAN